MRYKSLALIISIITICQISLFAQDQKRTAENDRMYDNSVWYNARRGNASAMNQVGIWYYSGNKVGRDYTQAFYWWSKGALEQNAKAIANLGICYQYGRGVERDSLSAIQLYITAIENGQYELFQQRQANTPGNLFDDMLVAFCYEKGIGTLRDPLRSAELYAHVAEAGSVEAMVRAAEMCIEIDRPLDAFKYFEQASNAGDIYATYMAGKMRMGQMGIAADKPKAVVNLRKAAEAGVPGAMTSYGTLLFSGEAIGQDLPEALVWLKKAAQKGDNEGIFNYFIALKQAKEYAQAVRWMRIACDCGYQKECDDLCGHLPSNDLFKIYLIGLHQYDTGNYDEAIRNFKTVGKGQIIDGKVMEAKALSQSSPSKGAKMLEKLASESPQAAFLLAEMYMNGRGVKTDRGKAIKLYRQAAKAGYGKAEDALGTIYYEGKYVGLDRKESLRLYKDALEQHELSSKGFGYLQELDPSMATYWSRIKQ